MKTVIRYLILLLFAIETPLAFCVAENRPSQAVLTTPLRLPVVSAGVSKGFVDAPRGTTVWVLQVKRKMLYIDFSGSETWIKRSATDYDERLAAYKANQKRMQAAIQQQHLQAAQQAPPPMQHNASLDVQAVGGGGGGENPQNAAFGYYNTIYESQTVQNRRTVLKISVRNFNTQPDHYQLQWYFFAKPTGHKHEFIFDTATKDLWLQGGEFKTFRVASKPVSAVVSRTLAVDYNGFEQAAAAKSGNELKGWMARVVADGKVIQVKASAFKYRDLAHNDKLLQQMQMVPQSAPAYPTY
ncbi:MAG: hypothetical protein WCD79_12160 [Chthoniobacteraceae bacterium]